MYIPPCTYRPAPLVGQAEAVDLVDDHRRDVEVEDVARAPQLALLEEGDDLARELGRRDGHEVDELRRAAQPQQRELYLWV